MVLDLESVTHLPCALLVVDRDARPLSGSRKGFSVFGVRLRRDGMKQALQGVQKALAGEADFLENVRSAMAHLHRPGGEEHLKWERTGRVFQVSVSRLGRAEDSPYSLLFDDVTQEIRFEETRELARRYLEDILNNIQLGVVVVNRDMRITNVNRAQEGYLKRLGNWVSWVEAIGMAISELVPQDSESLWKDITDRVLVQGQTYEDPRRVYATPEGDLILSVEIMPLRDQRGEAIGAIQISEDVTERVRLEEELREAEIVAQRLEAVRETAITVNHEVNNPLATILATAQMLLMADKDLSENVREKLAQIERDVKRIAEVTKALRSVEQVRTTDYIPRGPKMLDLGLDQ